MWYSFIGIQLSYNAPVMVPDCTGPAIKRWISVTPVSSKKCLFSLNRFINLSISVSLLIPFIFSSSISIFNLFFLRKVSTEFLIEPPVGVRESAKATGLSVCTPANIFLNSLNFGTRGKCLALNFLCFHNL